MSDLFSDAAPPPPLPDRAPDLRFSVTVPVPPEHALAGFVEHLHLWWPADLLSVWGEESFFDLETNALVETSVEEQEIVWAERRPTEDPLALDLWWHHQLPKTDVTEVILSFSPGPESGTSLDLVHQGWTSGAQATTDRTFYDGFWPLALARFARFMGGAS